LRSGTRRRTAPSHRRRPGGTRTPRERGRGGTRTPREAEEEQERLDREADESAAEIEREAYESAAELERDTDSWSSGIVFLTLRNCNLLLPYLGQI